MSSSTVHFSIPILPLTLPYLWPNPSFGLSRGAGWLPEFLLLTYTHLYKLKGKAFLANQKQNFSSPALFSPLTTPRLKMMENTAVTGTLQENKFKDFPKAKGSPA